MKDRQKHLDYHREYMREWRIKNADRLKEIYASETFKQRRKIQAKVYREKYKDKISDYHKELYKNDSQRMRKRMDAWRAKNLDRWNGYGRKRRAMIKGLAHEPYSGVDILARDNETCQLCLAYIDSSLRFPDTKSFSVDHILPIALGGSDTPDNVQASHLGCNARKAHYVKG